MKILRSRKTGLFYAGQWLDNGKIWRTTKEFCRKYNQKGQAEKHKIFLDSKGFDIEILEVTKEECYGKNRSI